MFWFVFWLAGALLFAGLAFGLGAALGASSANSDQYLSLLIPTLGAVGGWVAGIGALAAALTALWIAEQQKKFELPRLSVSVSGTFTIRLVNHGRLPVGVNGRDFLLTGKSSSYWLGADLLNSNPFQTLGFGESVTFRFSDEVEDHIAHWVMKDAKGEIDHLRFIVSTPAKAFDFPLDSYMKHRLKHAVRKLQKSEV